MPHATPCCLSHQLDDAWLHVEQLLLQLRAQDRRVYEERLAMLRGHLSLLIHDLYAAQQSHAEEI